MSVLKRLFNRYPVLTRFIIFVVFPCVAILFFAFFYLSKSLQESESRFHVPGLKEPVLIKRNNGFMPTISAKNNKDAYFAMGYIHGRDRLWQMEVTRRLMTGRISEVVGVQGLASDKYMRTLGLAKDLPDTWKKLKPDTQEFMSAYSDGVNFAINSFDVLPAEFLYFNLRPEPWTVYDSLTVVKSMTLLMSRNYKEELRRASLINIFGVERSKDLFPEVAQSDVNSLAAYFKSPANKPNDNQHTDNYVAGILGTHDIYTGSNNWVVAGRHTASGMPLLANDPHVLTSTPAAWYVASINGDTVNATGATLPGFPFVITGHNKKIAWGVTNMQADVQDIRLERIDSITNDTYVKDGVSKKISARQEFINIKADPFRKAIAPVSINIRETENGPIISDVIGGDDGSVYSLTWVIREGLAGTVESFRNINYAYDWDSFRESLRTYVAPVQNFIYADIAGNIGYIAPGLIPIRGRGEGAIPMPGWSSEYDWKGWIPFDELPQAYNPASGMIVTANNRVVDDQYPYHITSDWFPSYRADRIKQLLNEFISSGHKISASDFQKIQGDSKSLAAQSLMPYLIATPPASDRQKQVLDQLKLWDGDFVKDSIGASIFTSWVKNFNSLILEDEVDGRALSTVKKMYFNGLLSDVNYEFLESVLNGSKKSWCDYKRTKNIESCNDLLSKSLDNAIAELEKVAGTDIDSWDWRSLHKTQFVHFPFSRADLSNGLPSVNNKLMHFLAHRSIAAAGDKNTINMAPASGENSIKMFLQFAGATYRQIVDLSSFEHSGFMVAPGQSGNILSKHYDDLITPHNELQMMQLTGQADENSSVTLNP